MNLLRESESLKIEFGKTCNDFINPLSKDIKSNHPTFKYTHNNIPGPHGIAFCKYVKPNVNIFTKKSNQISIQLKV